MDAINMFPSPLEVNRFISQVGYLLQSHKVSFRPLSRWIGLYQNKGMGIVYGFVFPSPREVNKFISDYMTILRRFPM